MSQEDPIDVERAVALESDGTHDHQMHDEVESWRQCPPRVCFRPRGNRILDVLWDKILQDYLGLNPGRRSETSRADMQLRFATGYYPKHTNESRGWLTVVLRAGEAHGGAAFDGIVKPTWFEEQGLCMFQLTAQQWRGGRTRTKKQRTN